MSTTAKILIIEDSKAMRDRIGRILLDAGLAGEVFHAANGLEGFKILFHHRPDLVLCDITMPHIDGWRFLEMRGTREELRDIPVLMLTAAEDTDNKVRALGKGAVDYITKPFEETELIARVKVHLQIKSLQDELRHANALLEKLSVTDGLTAVYNRRHLMQELEKEFTRASRYDGTFAFLMIDVDHFKDINDRYGHLMGDFVLRELAKIVFQQLRASDVLARYGGEEFAAILPGTDLKGAQSLAERIRRVVEEHPFKHGSAFAKITVSVGVVTYPGIEAQSVDDVIREADAALYRAKELGRNLVQARGRSA